MERVTWEWYHPLKFLISSRGEIKKSTGTRTFGTLVNGRRWVKRNGARRCVAIMVLETHRPLGGPYTDELGVVLWKDGDPANNDIRNLEWILKNPVRHSAEAIRGPHKRVQPLGDSDQFRQE